MAKRIAAGAHGARHSSREEIMKFIGQLLSQHLERYPRMALADIYKLLHQAALGPGHAVTDASSAHAALASEAASLGEGPADPLTDPISPDGRLARIHLRAYVVAGHDLDKLANAFVQTAATYSGSRDKLAKFCACLGDLADAGGIPFSRAEVGTYFDEIVAQGYPVVRHSEDYRTAYHPAYRVVDLQLLESVR
jgi:hypothetical protein